MCHQHVGLFRCCKVIILHTGGWDASKPVMAILLQSVWSPSQNVCGHHTAQNKNEFVAASPSVPCTGSHE